MISIMEKYLLSVLFFVFGAIFGRRTATYWRDFASEVGEDTEIAHVGYTPEQMGYDK